MSKKYQVYTKQDNCIRVFRTCDTKEETQIVRDTLIGADVEYNIQPRLEVFSIPEDWERIERTYPEVQEVVSRHYEEYYSQSVEEYYEEE